MVTYRQVSRWCKLALTREMGHLNQEQGSLSASLLAGRLEAATGGAVAAAGSAAAAAAASAARAVSCGTNDSARLGTSAGLVLVHLQYAIPWNITKCSSGQPQASVCLVT